VDESIPAVTGESVAPTSTGVGTTQPSTTTREHAPKPSKRNSLFGNLFNKVSSPSQEKSERDVGPTVPVKDTDTAPVSAVAPQLADPVDISAPEPVASTGETDPVTAGTSTTRQNWTSSSPPKGGIFAFMKQKEVKHEVRQSASVSSADHCLQFVGEEGYQSRREGREERRRAIRCDWDPNCSWQRCAGYDIRSQRNS